MYQKIIQIGDTGAARFYVYSHYKSIVRPEKSKKDILYDFRVEILNGEIEKIYMHSFSDIICYFEPDENNIYRPENNLFPTHDLALQKYLLADDIRIYVVGKKGTTILFMHDQDNVANKNLDEEKYIPFIEKGQPNNYFYYHGRMYKQFYYY
jgi:hypothetical protein